MKTIRNACALILTFLVSISCSKSGLKALESGEYYNAVIQAVDKLKKDSDNSKALKVLPKAYKYASEDLLKDISNARKSNAQFKYERVVNDYKKLNDLHDKIVTCVPCRNIVEPDAYFSELESAALNAADERYSFANNLLNKGTIESARAAFQNFDILLSYAPNYKNAREKLDESLFSGSYHVVLEPPIVNSKLYQYSNEFFISKIDEFLQKNKRLNKFIIFYQPEEAKQLKLNPDHVVRLEFIDFVVGETFIKSEKEKVTSKDSVKVGEAKIADKIVDVWGLVDATVIKNVKTVRSRGILSMEIYNYKTKKNLLREELPGEFLWINTWATYNGDERALRPQDIKETKKVEELPPAPQQLFIEFSKPIYDQFTSRIKRFYDSY